MKNNIENLIIALVVFIFGSATGGYIGYNASLSTTKAVVELQAETIRQAIEKETNSIKNVITNTFEKKSFKKAEGINIILDSETRSILNVNDSTESQEKEERRGFFKRIFNKNKTR